MSRKAAPGRSRAGQRGAARRPRVAPRCSGLGESAGSWHHEDLIVLKELIEAGKITPVIDRTYPLSEVPKAIRYMEQGKAQGKVVITV